MLRRFALVLALLSLPGAMQGQYYFGQNKVQYRTFDFKVLKTEHFDIYFYPETREAALDAGRMAERSYVRLSRLLRHEYKERKPIILYASQSDFQQTNALGGEAPGEGTGGVTDFFKQRIILPFTGSYEELEHVLQHEMVHQFQYDMWSRGRAGAGLATIISVNPPLWFVEGMAEYFSIGGVDPNTAMWLRDAAIEGKIPTIDQLENDPRIFPYRYGQALLAFIGGRWGDEAVGAIMQGTMAGGGGLEGSIRRVLGLDYKELSALWREHVQRIYLPQVASQQRAQDLAQPVLTEARSQGTLHLAPALSPDGREIAYFSEKDFYFVDLYLADAATGKVKRRLLKSSYSSNYETFRFINSAVSWSADGKYIAMAAKRGPRDDILIVDVARNREARRIQVPLSGVTTPAWSPDGQQLVFSGYDGGLSDLYLVNADGTNLRRLTHDRYADLHPVWSPDGSTIAFATDRGPETDFRTLHIGDMRIATLDLATNRLDLLPGMDHGLNVSSQWSPDGQRLGFVSDRTGVSNIFLYDRNDQQIYQITDLFTGAQGITPLSPVLSWARAADRLAFVYYARDRYDVYSIDHPEQLRREPWQAPAVALRDSAAVPRDSTTVPVHQAPDSAAAGALETPGSIYVGKGGFRPADSAAAGPDSLNPMVSISALMDSVKIPLPDTAEFTVRPYKVKFQPDYVARPSIGYTRDNFGSGFYGGSAVAFSDLLGDHQMFFALYVNGRITEALVNATYVNTRHRLNWAISGGQEPYYFYEPDQIAIVDADTRLYITNLRRIVWRSARAQAIYPLDRFRRIELGAAVVHVTDHLQQIIQPYNPNPPYNTQGNITSSEISLGSAAFVQPTVAFTFDNSLFGYVGPFYGRRYRVQVSQALGGWRYFESLVDYRRYDKIVGPLTFATRALYFGRNGPQAERFRMFLGNTELLRGNTSGSYYGNECLVNQPGTFTGCAALDRLVGTRIALGSAELRFPILTPQIGGPSGFPPIEGALFYDVGIAWNEGNQLQWTRKPGDDPVRVRTPMQTLGASARMNFFNFVVLRLDYSVPQERTAVKGLWTLSLGPVF